MDVLKLGKMSRPSIFVVPITFKGANNLLEFNFKLNTGRQKSSDLKWDEKLLPTTMFQLYMNPCIDLGWSLLKTIKPNIGLSLRFLKTDS